MDFIFDDEVDESSEIEAYCPKCKADTPHVVVHKYEDEIRRVQCTPCGDVHPYRKPRGETEEEAPEPVVKRRSSKVKPTWEQVMARPRKEQPRAYSISEEFSEGEFISHATFGLGFVSELLGTDKIEATFQSGRRILVHNRRPNAQRKTIDLSGPPVLPVAVTTSPPRSSAGSAARRAVAPPPVLDLDDEPVLPETLEGEEFEVGELEDTEEGAGAEGLEELDGMEEADESPRPRRKGEAAKGAAKAPGRKGASSKAKAVVVKDEDEDLDDEDGDLDGEDEDLDLDEEEDLDDEDLDEDEKPAKKAATKSSKGATAQTKAKPRAAAAGARAKRARSDSTKATATSTSGASARKKAKKRP